VAKTQSGWDAAFYENAAGEKPVKDFLEDLEATDPDQADTVYRKLVIFAERGWDDSVKSGLLKHVDGKIFEIKVKGEQARVLGFGWRKLFIAAAAEIKKTDDLDPSTVRAAEERRDDWIKRNGA
jgi:hypothetical protein